ncbi:hypothetical protein CANARDRAFT_30357 [[Candida] arabinofermentans NRRL YB-2248]|uniref:Ribosomal protein n=1 Tax=[Candida] arabinofermentans NRRL YB-2248 TaxID=983967 RepID=A0A1E4SU55_9ASCO|nr:hypothetical protein CANARDRAFT_30357 [[Candida] arabinofermentans NRRL YB-2248]
MSLIKSLTCKAINFTPQSSITFRSFSITSIQQAPKTKKEQDAKKLSEKRIARKDAQRKALAKKPASSSPLFMEIPQALRYLRAAEVGRPLNEAVLNIRTTVLSERGVAPLSGAVRFPKPLKETRICVLSNDELKRKEALELGAVTVGDSKFIDEIQNGNVDLNFDKIIATTDIETSLRKVARILGPRGLMPNAKKGTVTNDIKEVISESLGTQPFRQKNSCVALTVAKCNFTDEDIVKNIMATSKAVRDSVASIKSKKPILVGETVLSTTHGPGIVINF